MNNIVLFGPPGAGKGTQSEKLIEKYKLVHISTGDLFRNHISNNTELGVRAKTYMDDGMLVPDQLVIDMVDDKISNSQNVNGYIFDGFPRTVPQAEALDQLLNTKQTPIQVMLMLEVDQEELVRRLLLRGQESGRVDDQNEEKIRTRIRVYQNETLPVADFYAAQGKLNKVGGIGEIDDIFNRLCEIIEK